MLARRRDEQRDPVVLQVQRRLKPTEIDELVAMYEAGSSVAVAAESFDVNRETVLLHLERQGIRRRANLSKMTESQVANCARLYLAGGSMAALCEYAEVNPTTMRRELVKAGVRLRPGGRPKRFVGTPS